MAFTVRGAREETTNERGVGREDAACVPHAAARYPIMRSYAIQSGSIAAPNERNKPRYASS